MTEGKESGGGIPGYSIRGYPLSPLVGCPSPGIGRARWHRIIQCDICRAPLNPQSFDAVVCLGVIQHTPDPEHTIRKLFELVKPGGWLNNSKRL